MEPDEFIGRAEEMAVLESQYEGVRHPLVQIVGRRRVGKSELICRFVEGRNALYYEADREQATSLLRSFSEAVCRYTGEECTYADWGQAVRGFVTRGPPGRKVLAIDEFQYIAMSDPDFVKAFQSIWDTYLSKQDVMVIVCGSYISMMSRIFSEYRSPLYGRSTSVLVIAPIAFRDTVRGRDYRRAVEEYALTGGVPYYMALMSDGSTVLENIERTVMGVGAPLVNEPKFLLSDELRDPTSYMTYLKVLAQGNRKMDAITSAVQAKSSDVAPYLRTLADMGLIERRVPVTEPAPERNRSGQYVITDCFIRFWFRFAYPYLGDITRRRSAAALREVADHFVDSHVAFVFEDICREELYRHLESAGVAATVGSYWDRSVEIDVVALDRAGATVYAGECKYWERPVGADVLRSLVEKCGRVARFEGYRVVPCLFSASGYTDAAVSEAAEAGAILFDCGEPLKN